VSLASCGPAAAIPLPRYTNCTSSPASHLTCEGACSWLCARTSLSVLGVGLGSEWLSRFKCCRVPTSCNAFSDRRLSTIIAAAAGSAAMPLTTSFSVILCSSSAPLKARSSCTHYPLRPHRMPLSLNIARPQEGMRSEGFWLQAPLAQHAKARPHESQHHNCLNRVSWPMV
jgi:hypothetical protein